MEVYDLPRVEDEIQRKTQESVAWILKQFKTRAISAHAADTAIQALFIATAGLVSTEQIQIFTNISKVLESPTYMDKHIFIDFAGTRFSQVRAIPEELKVEVQAFNAWGEPLATKSYSAEDEDGFVALVTDRRERFALAGWVEVK
jgi:hypothetical protein